MHAQRHAETSRRSPFRPADPRNPYADYTVEQLYAFLAECEPSRKPGTAAAGGQQDGELTRRAGVG